MPWPDSFYKMRRGDGCPFCREGRPEVNHDGIRYYAGEVCDAYLRRSAIQRGYTVAVWRGRHVAEPTELTGDEAAGYWNELLTVGRILEQTLRPIKLNYNILGNVVPHLHTHIIPRYEEGDPHPGAPFPFPLDTPPDFDDAAYQAEVALLQSASRAALLPDN